MYIVVCVATLTSSVKGFHAYKNKLILDQNYIASLNWKILSAKKAIIVKTKEGDTVGHVPALLAHALAPEISGGNEVSIETIVTGEQRRAPEGVWVIGHGIETPCKYLIYTDKKLKSKIKQCLEMHQCN